MFKFSSFRSYKCTDIMHHRQDKSKQHEFDPRRGGLNLFTDNVSQCWPDNIPSRDQTSSTPSIDLLNAYWGRLALDSKPTYAHNSANPVDAGPGSIYPSSLNKSLLPF